MSILSTFEDHQRVVATATSQLVPEVEKVGRICVDSLQRRGKILVCGNGGSAADAQHFAAELVGRFVRERRAYPAIALTTDTSALTAIANDYGYEKVFSRQVEALARPGDVLLAISTSGNSASILEAAAAARSLECKVVGMTGEGGGQLGQLADLLLSAPSRVVARIQEVHELCLHSLAEYIEKELVRLSEGQERE